MTLAVGVMLSVFAADQVRRATERDTIAAFAFTSDQLTIKVQERLNAYALVLRGGAGLFESSEEVTREEWQSFIRKLHVSDTISEEQHFGFAPLILPEGLEAHEAELRERFPNYTVHPRWAGEAHAPVLYLEPLRAHDLRILGMDMLVDQGMRDALLRARDSGLSTLSGKVGALRENIDTAQATILMAMPVYLQGVPVDSVTQRRDALVGWTFSPFPMNDWMGRVLQNWERLSGRNVSLRLYDGLEPGSRDLLFSSHEPAVDPSSRWQQRRSIHFNDRDWLLMFDEPDPGVGLYYGAAWTTLAGGLGLTGLLSALILSIASTRTRAIRLAARLTEEIKAREAQLEESEFRWRFAIEGSGAGLWDWTLDDDSVFYSERWKHILDFSGEEIGTSVDEWQSRLHPDDRSRVMAALQACLNGETGVYSDEHRMQCRDGGWKWVMSRGVVVSRAPDGRPLRMIGTSTDISRRKALEAARETLLDQFQTIAARVPGLVFEFRLYPDGHVSFPYVSEGIRQLYGLAPEVVREHAVSALRAVHSQDRRRFIASIVRSARNLSPWQHEYRSQLRDGSIRWLFGDALPHRAEGGAVTWYGVITDITERKESELELRRAYAENRRFREALDHVSSYIYMKDTHCRYTYANRATLRLFNCSTEALTGAEDSDFLPPASVHRLRQIDRRVLRGEQTREEVELVDSQGRNRTYLEIKTPIHDETEAREIIGLLGISTDITALKEHEMQLERIAHYDALTHLPNRVLLADRLYQAMSQAQRRGLHIAVVYLDLDGFKAINDRYGHSMGDRFLMALAGRMKESLRDGDTLSRLGGDEFVAVLLDLPAPEAGTPLLLRLLDAASRSVRIDGHVLQVSASLGVAFYPQAEPIEADQLLRQADQAMYQAKLAGKNRFHRFDADLDRSLRTRHESIERIRAALEAEEFVLHYQPKVNLRTGEIIGAEALIRWRHPERGLLPPAHFLPEIEDHSLGIAVGEWVIKTALGQAALWRAEGFRIPVSVNIGARQLRQNDFPSRLKGLLARQPEVSPDFLELEVLETSALGDLVQVSRLLEECRAIGVNVALDDFGTGYSSLTYLKRLPAGVVKVDQSFVRDILEDPDDLAILDGVLGLASAFGRQVIAEGVETPSHGDMLLRIGCELGQGYGIARPMPAESLRDWIRHWQPSPRWAQLRRLNREYLPLLYTQVEHRAWIQELADALRAGSRDLPKLIHDPAVFSRWMDESGFQPCPGFETVDRLHRQVHQSAGVLYELHARGDIQAACHRLDELIELRDALSKALDDYLG
ncbi:EAL domain-containing protein [Ectothiorhodospira shaposhnikovii]|uniref:EAL domain-containing protein n=1 Tax=Ectothiorhodospira shaposhnikovii TaxID=1054 RepID=UPI001EE81A82|nr:EAL domain-containing protein [Ectothiorhodospira shaposhnikovii]MCG5513518.1 EAL domain-containing protein [Ectothiorhodospira shaposhnikovii]